MSNFVPSYACSFVPISSTVYLEWYHVLVNFEKNIIERKRLPVPVSTFAIRISRCSSSSLVCSVLPVSIWEVHLCLGLYVQHCLSTSWWSSLHVDCSHYCCCHRWITRERHSRPTWSRYVLSPSKKLLTTWPARGNRRAKHESGSLALKKGLTAGYISGAERCLYVYSLILSLLYFYYNCMCTYSIANTYILSVTISLLAECRWWPSDQDQRMCSGPLIDCHPWGLLIAFSDIAWTKHRGNSARSSTRCTSELRTLSHIFALSLSFVAVSGPVRGICAVKSNRRNSRLSCVSHRMPPLVILVTLWPYRCRESLGSEVFLL